MKILKKLTAVVMAAVMSAAMLTACSGGGSGGNGGITTKKISYKESRMATVSSTGQLYMEQEDMKAGQKVKIEIAAKDNKTYVSAFKDKTVWTTDITVDGNGYIITYPEDPEYNYKDANGTKRTVPVYRTYEGTKGKGVDLIWGSISDDAEVGTGEYTINGKSYYAETINGVVYCFEGNTLKAVVKAPGNIVMIYNFRNTNVPNSLFEIPSDAEPE